MTSTSVLIWLPQWRTNSAFDILYRVILPYVFQVGGQNRPPRIFFTGRLSKTPFRIVLGTCVWSPMNKRFRAIFRVRCRLYCMLLMVRHMLVKYVFYVANALAGTHIQKKKKFWTLDIKSWNIKFKELGKWEVVEVKKIQRWRENAKFAMKNRWYAARWKTTLRRMVVQRARVGPASALRKSKKSRSHRPHIFVVGHAS